MSVITTPKYFRITRKQLAIFEHELYEAGYGKHADEGDNMTWTKPGAPTYVLRDHPFPMIGLDLGERN
jgi:hypothetical protein